MKVTVEWIKKQIEEIARFNGDDEAQHSREDELYIKVLESIASGECEDPAECAKAALFTQQMKFNRWAA